MAIDPRGADLKRFLQDGEPGEVVMISLLRFVEGGREHYEEYARGAGVSSVGLEDKAPVAPSEEERNSILDLFRKR